MRLNHDGWRHCTAMMGLMELTSLSASVEAVSAAYASKLDIERTPEWAVLKLNEEVGELTQAFLAFSGRARSRGKTDTELRSGVADELADVIGQALVLGTLLDIDMPEAIRDKWLSWEGKQ